MRIEDPVLVRDAAARRYEKGVHLLRTLELTLPVKCVLDKVEQVVQYYLNLQQYAKVVYIYILVVGLHSPIVLLYSKVEMHTYSEMHTYLFLVLFMRC